MASENLQKILSYTPPVLRTNINDWHVLFYAFDPARGEMRRKRIKLNFIKRIPDRRRYAGELIKRLHFQLERGWNPWIEDDDSRSYHTFDDVCKHYVKYITKLHADMFYREDTYKAYLSYIRCIQRFNNQYREKITYIYQFNRRFIDEMLEWIYMDQNNSPQTRNNYLGFVRLFSTFLVQHRYAKTKPCEGIPMFRKSQIKKERTVLSSEAIVSLREYLENKNKHYLLACYLLYYCFIRPKEMSLIKISDFSLVRQTLFIPDKNSKNRKDGTLTLPAKIIHYMISLKIFDNPGSYYLFSDGFQPGEKYKSDKCFRDFWSYYVRKELKFPANYKFYSLKDSGITNMLRSLDNISVRDQARHSSILITDIYTPHDLQEANSVIKNHEGDF